MPHRKLRHRKHLTLRRDLGLVEATFAGVGIILGAGIYALIGEGAAIAGNSLWLSFFIASLVAAFTGLSYAELSSRFPKDAGEYTYAQKAFSKRIGWMVAWLIIFEGVVSAAAVALGFAGYFNSLFANFFTLPLIAVALGCIALFSYINFYGIKQTAWINIVFTLLEAGGLIAIILLALKFIGTRPINYFEMPAGWGGTFAAASLIFFAFIGFEAIVKLSEETKNAKKIIPRALILSIIITTLLYVLVAIASVTIMGWEALGASKSPLADVAAIALGNNAFLAISLIALFSTSNTVLMIMVTTARLLYGLGNEYKKINFFSRIHKTRKTPWIAVAVVMIVSMIFALIGDIRVVAEITNFSIFAVFAIVNAALIVVRYKLPAAKKDCFRMPLNIGKFPVIAFLGIVVSLFMLKHLGYIAIVGGIVMLIVGYAVSFAIEDKKKK